MKLRLPLALAIAAAATFTVPSMSWAADTASAGCPASKELLSIRLTLKKVDFSIYDRDEKAAITDLITSLDVNGNNDGYLCSKQFKPNLGQDKQFGANDYVITQISDNQPTGAL